ncbi:MAG: hypothetical protein S4CHLAM6_10450 [Chlamydiae bacterium]|nr:hypothetical protein [Chlamydiota bacterium]
MHKILATIFFSCLTFYLPLFSEDSKKADVALISLAKSGTHLISKSIEKFTGKSRGYTPNYKYLNKLPDKNFAGTHFCHPKVVNKLLASPHIEKILLNIRDPRDVLVSAAYYYNEFKYMDFSCPEDIRDLFSFRARKIKVREKIRFFLKQALIGKHMPTMVYGTRAATKFIRKLEPHSDKFLVIKFEDLVGEKGGGSQATQQKTLEKISHFLGKNYDEKQLKSISKDLFGNAETFRSGTTGSWKTHFDEVTKKMFKVLLGDELIELGYEKDNSW